MSKVLQNNKVTIFLGRVELFCLFVACSYTSWKLQCYPVVLVWYGPACPNFSEATNHQYIWKGSCDFVDFLQVVICIMLDIHWSYKNMLFWAGIVGHSLSLNQIVRCFKLKKAQKEDELSSWFFASIETRRTSKLLFCVMIPIYSWPIGLQDILLLAC